MIGIMHSFHCQKISLPEESQGAAVGCIVNFQNRKILIVSFYNPPQTSHYHLNDEMIKLIFKEIETLMTQVDATIIYGNFNLDIDWNIRSSENCESQSFLDEVDHLELEQHIDFPTAATGTLDLLFSKGELNLVSTKVKPLSISSMSNHFPITAKFEIRKVNNVFRSYHNESKMFSYCKADFKALNADIIDNPFQGFCWSNPDVLLSDWYKWLNIKIERHVPTRTRHRGRLAPRITQSTSNIIMKLNTAKKKYPALHNRVSSLQKECDFAVEQDQINFESELYDSRSTDKLFKFYRTFKSSRVPSKLIYGSKEAQSNAEKVELFADFFDDFTNARSKPSDPPSLGEPQNLSTTKLDDFDISEQRIQNICRTLDCTKASGPDKIPAILYKNCSKNIAKSLNVLFYKIKQTCSFPSYWKCAIVNPTNKKSCKYMVENYRPVSLLAIVSKTFERCMFLDIYEFFEPLISNQQYGFRKERSCVVQMIVYLNKVYKAINDGKSVEVVYTNYEKAFDRVDHQLLLRKNQNIGISGKLLKLLSSYLTKRTHKIRVENQLSTERLLNSGVPQGSILASILFLIYINDIPSQCKFSTPLICADDVKFININQQSNIFQTDLDRVFKWNSSHKQPLHVGKCSYMSFTGECNQMTFNNIATPEVEVQKDLGLLVSRIMKWNETISNNISKALKTFYMLKRITSKGLPMRVKLNIFKSMILHVLLYGSSC